MISVNDKNQRGSVVNPAFVLAALVGLTVLSPRAGAETLKQVGQPYELAADLAGKTTKKGKIKPADDVSGIACMPSAGATQACLLVNDENGGAQFVTIAGTILRPGAEVDLVGRAATRAIRGTAPTSGGCTLGQGAGGEMDGEAVAYAAPFFYVTGSHGCSRRGREYLESSFVLARIRLDESGTAAASVETTHRLIDALSAVDALKPYLLKDLEPRGQGKSPQGLNVEGLAVVGDRLYAGLRAPVLDGQAFLVPASAAALFEPGEPAMPAPQPIRLALGPEAGIRDLSALPDGDLLILSGPAENGKDGPYGLFRLNPATGALTELGTLPSVEGMNAKGEQTKGKPEAIARLYKGRVLVLFDSLLNGAPRAYEVAIP